MRAAAIIFVFVFHYGRLFEHPKWTNTISTFGWTGVDLFFVLSGYLIASQLFYKISDQGIFSLKEFYLKRFFRILPLYIFIVSVYFLFPFLREKERLAPFWKYITFTQNISLDVLNKGTFSHAWSLCVEEQFYFLFPLILLLLLHFNLFKKGWLLLLMLFIAGLAARIYCWHFLSTNFSPEDDNFYNEWSKLIYYPTWSRLDGLLTGISIAALFQFIPKIKICIHNYGNHLLAAGLFIFIITYFICPDTISFNASVFGFPLVAIGYGFIVAGAVCPTCFLYKINSAVTAKIATLSYSIYLSHKIIIHITQEYFSKMKIQTNSNFVFICCTASVFSGAFILNVLIEKPFLKLRKKING